MADTAIPARAGWLTRGRAWLESKLPALTRLRQREALPIVLHRRRLYTLPTRFGLFFAVLLFVMTLGALNFNNNPALILVFLLASAMHTALLLGFFGLKDLRITQLQSQPVHAGQAAQVTLHAQTRQPKARRGIEFITDDDHAALDVDDEGMGKVTLDIPTQQRGWHALARIKIVNRRPLGMFYIWSWIHPEHQVLVYPHPEPHAPSLPTHAEHGSEQAKRGMGDEIHGLRTFRMGDPLRHMAWKRSAQSHEWLVREWEQPSGHDVHLNWQQVSHLPREQAISRLTAWVLQAHREQCAWALDLPEVNLPMQQGDAHRHQSLKALALLS